MDCIFQKDAQELYGAAGNLQWITALIQGTQMANIHGMQNAAGGAKCAGLALSSVIIIKMPKLGFKCLSLKKS